MWYTIKRALTPVNAMQCTVLPHITASVFINDDERGLHADYERWLEEVFSRLHPAPSAPRRFTGQISQRQATPDL